MIRLCRRLRCKEIKSKIAHLCVNRICKWSSLRIRMISAPTYPSYTCNSFVKKCLGFYTGQGNLTRQTASFKGCNSVYLKLDHILVPHPPLQGNGTVMTNFCARYKATQQTALALGTRSQKNMWTWRTTAVTIKRVQESDRFSGYDWRPGACKLAQLSIGSVLAEQELQHSVMLHQVWLWDYRACGQ